MLPRRRQVVLAAADLDAVAADLEREVGVRTPFHDEGVGHFGLRNAVYSLGDSFVEIVSPIRADTAVGRQLERCGGDAGYMLMFEVADVAETRRRLADLGVRIVWDTEPAAIVDLHLPPKDVGGALVALDVTNPVGSWRWGGEQWTATAPEPEPGGIRGLTVAVRDPATVARRWAEVIGTEPPAEPVFTVAGGRQQVRFVETSDEERIVAVDVSVAKGSDVAVPGRSGDVTIAGVSFHRIDDKELD